MIEPLSRPSHTEEPSPRRASDKLILLLGSTGPGTGLTTAADAFTNEFGFEGYYDAGKIRRAAALLWRKWVLDHAKTPENDKEIHKLWTEFEATFLTLFKQFGPAGIHAYLWPALQEGGSDADLHAFNPALNEYSQEKRFWEQLPDRQQLWFLQNESGSSYKKIAAGKLVTVIDRLFTDPSDTESQQDYSLPADAIIVKVILTCGSDEPGYEDLEGLEEAAWRAGSREFAKQLAKQDEVNAHDLALVTVQIFTLHQLQQEIPEELQIKYLALSQKRYEIDRLLALDHTEKRRFLIEKHLPSIRKRNRDDWERYGAIYGLTERDIRESAIEIKTNQSKPREVIARIFDIFLAHLPQLSGGLIQYVINIIEPDSEFDTQEFVPIQLEPENEDTELKDEPPTELKTTGTEETTKDTTVNDAAESFPRSTLLEFEKRYEGSNNVTPPTNNNSSFAVT